MFAKGLFVYRNDGSNDNYLNDTIVKNDPDSDNNNNDEA